MQDQTPLPSLLPSHVLWALLLSLPRNGSVLSVAFPGHEITGLLAGSRVGTTLIQALSADLLARLADCADSLAAAPQADLLVAAEPGTLHPARSRALGAGHVVQTLPERPVRSLRAVVGTARDLRLVLVDSHSDAGGLARTALSEMAARGVPLWLELPSGDAPAQAAALRAAPDAAAFEWFGLCADGGGLIGDPPADRPLIALLGVPRGAWSCHGLRRLAETPDAITQLRRLRLPLIAPGGRNLPEDLRDALLETGEVPRLPQRPDRIFLPAGTRVFASGCRVAPLPGRGTPGLHTRGQGTVRVLFVPPVPGPFDLGLALAAPPPHPVTLRVGATMLPCAWAEDLSQLRAQVELVATPGQIFVLDLACLQPGRGLVLSIEGVDLVRSGQLPAGRQPAAAAMNPQGDLATT